MDALLARDLTQEVLDAARAVHAKTSLRLPDACCEALAIELSRRSIPFVQDAKLPVFYGNEYVGTQPVAFLCGDLVVQVCDRAMPQPQLGNLLKSTRRHRGLWLDFYDRSLGHKRVQVLQAGQDAPEGVVGRTVSDRVP